MGALTASLPFATAATRLFSLTSPRLRACMRIVCLCFCLSRWAPLGGVAFQPYNTERVLFHPKWLLLWSGIISLPVDFDALAGRVGVPGISNNDRGHTMSVLTRDHHRRNPYIPRREHHTTTVNHACIQPHGSMVRPPCGLAQPLPTSAQTEPQRTWQDA